jgi:hypothetical protein
MEYLLKETINNNEWTRIRDGMGTKKGSKCKEMTTKFRKPGPARFPQ